MKGGGGGAQGLPPSLSGVPRLLRLPRFRSAYLVRGGLCWAGLRLFLLAFGFVDPGLLERALVVGVVALAVLLDARRRDEDLFLANLGIPGGTIFLVALALPALLELVVP